MSLRKLFVSGSRLFATKTKPFKIHWLGNVKPENVPPHTVSIAGDASHLHELSKELSKEGIQSIIYNSRGEYFLDAWQSGPAAFFKQIDRAAGRALLSEEKTIHANAKK